MNQNSVFWDKLLRTVHWIVLFHWFRKHCFQHSWLAYSKAQNWATNIRHFVKNFAASRRAAGWPSPMFMTHWPDFSVSPKLSFTNTSVPVAAHANANLVLRFAAGECTQPLCVTLRVSEHHATVPFIVVTKKTFLTRSHPRKHPLPPCFPQRQGSQK